MTIELLMKKVGEGLNHLSSRCSHILLCWLIKVVVAIFLIYMALFIGRLDLWLVSTISFEEFQNSLEGIMDNILITLISFGIHIGIFFILHLLIKIIRKPNSPNVTRLRKDLRELAGIMLAVIVAVILPGFKARLLLWIFFGVDWNRFAINFGTGGNFTWHFSLGVLSVLLDVICISSSKWLYQDFKKYREQKSRQIPCY